MTREQMIDKAVRRTMSAQGAIPIGLLRFMEHNPTDWIAERFVYCTRNIFREVESETA